MASSIRLTNSKGRDATVGIATCKSLPHAKMGLLDETVEFRRYLAATEAGAFQALSETYGEDLAKTLIESDPEIDLERVGATISGTQTVFLDSSGAILMAEPEFIDVITRPDGSEVERKEPVVTESNVDTDIPLRWTGRKISIADAVRRFLFKRIIALSHSDGVTYDYLYAMAKELEDSGTVMLIGAGDKGTGPLIFQSNGRPYRGFLSGKTDGKKYQLHLLLSDMEMKKPFIKANG